MVKALNPHVREAGGEQGSKAASCQCSGGRSAVPIAVSGWKGWLYCQVKTTLWLLLQSGGTDVTSLIGWESVFVEKQVKNRAGGEMCCLFSRVCSHTEQPGLLPNDIKWQLSARDRNALFCPAEKQAEQSRSQKGFSQFSQK